MGRLSSAYAAIIQALVVVGAIALVSATAYHFKRGSRFRWPLLAATVLYIPALALIAITFDGVLP